MRLSLTETDRQRLDQAMRTFREDFDERFALFREVLGERLFSDTREGVGERIRGNLLYRLILDATSRFLAEAGYIKPGLVFCENVDVDGAIAAGTSRAIYTPEFDSIVKSTPEEEASYRVALAAWLESGWPETPPPRCIEDTWEEMLISVVDDHTLRFSEATA